MIEFFVNLWYSHSLIELYVLSFICNLLILMPLGFTLYKMRTHGVFPMVYKFNPKPVFYWSLVPLTVIGLPILLLIDYIIYELKNT